MAQWPIKLAILALLLLVMWGATQIPMPPG